MNGVGRVQPVSREQGYQGCLVARIDVQFPAFVGHLDLDHHAVVVEPVRAAVRNQAGSLVRIAQ